MGVRVTIQSTGAGAGGCRDQEELGVALVGKAADGQILFTRLTAMAGSGPYRL